jgi:hypothetical protein
MKRLSITLALLSILAAGCRAEVRVLLDVSDNGTGNLAAEVGINDQLGDLITQLFGNDSEEVISGLDLGLVGTAATRVEGDMTVYTTEVAFTDVESIPEAAAGNFTSFRLDLTDEGASLEATLDLAGELDLSQFPLDPSTIDSENLLAEILVSVPGEPADNNADAVLADGRYRWTIPLDGELYMYVNTVYPKSDFPWWLVGLLALSGGLALAVWFAAVRRDKKGGTVRRPVPEPPPLERSSRQPDEESPFFELGES